MTTRAEDSADAPILVTGAAGFIGSRFVQSLKGKSTPLISVDRLSHFDSRLELEGIDFGQRIDRDALFSQLESMSPKLRAVVHLGACTDTMQLDTEFLDRVNLKYSQYLWNYCTRHQVPFVFASSAATYGGGEHGYDDDEALWDQLVPLNPYGQSKLDFDRWLLKQARAGNQPPVWSGFRFFNVYGFGERHKGRMASVVLHAFDQIRVSGRVKLFKSHRPDYGDGEQKRDFVFVDDVVSVLTHALGKPITRGVYNLGTGQARTFLDLARAVCAAVQKKTGVSAPIEFIDTPEALRERYQYFTQADIRRLRGMGYLAEFTPLEVGVTRTVERLFAEAERIRDNKPLR